MGKIGELINIKNKGRNDIMKVEMKGMKRKWQI